MKKHLALLVVLTFLIICCSCSNSADSQYRPAAYVSMAGEINAKIINTLSERYHMDVIGVTSGLADNVNTLGARFQIQGPLPKDKLRQLIVGCVEEYLNEINSDEKIRPFLKNYPFTSQEISVAILVVNKRLDLYHPEISAVANSGKIIWFGTVDQENASGYKLIEEETYDEALKIVKGQNAG